MCGCVGVRAGDGGTLMNSLSLSLSYTTGKLANGLYSLNRQISSRIQYVPFWLLLGPCKGDTGVMQGALLPSELR